MDKAAAAALAEIYAHSHGKYIKVGPMPHRDRPTGVGAAPDSMLPRDYVRMLRTALGPRRWEPWNPYPEHRSHPSPRTAFLAGVQVSFGTQHWRYDPVRDRLYPITDHIVHDPLDRLRLTLTAEPEHLSAGYGPLATALAWLECGHVAAALAETAAAIGLAVDWRQSPSGVTMVVRQGAPITLPWRRVSAGRSSGLAPRGLAWDPRPVPGQVMHDLVAAALSAPPGSPGSGILTHSLAVQGFSDLTAGWYSLDGNALALRRPGAAVEDIQSALTYPRQFVDVTGMKAGWVMTAPVTALVSAGGAAAYRRVLLAAGAVAQHIATMAATHGLICRPLRAVREAELEAAVLAEPGEDFVYLQVIGKQRVRDFAYDLTHPGEIG